MTSDIWGLIFLGTLAAAAFAFAAVLYRDFARRQGAMNEDEKLQEWIDGQW